MEGEPEEKGGGVHPPVPSLPGLREAVVSRVLTESPGSCLAALSCSSRSYWVPGTVPAAQYCCSPVHRHPSWLPLALPPTLLNAHPQSHVHLFHSFRSGPSFPTETYVTGEVTFTRSLGNSGLGGIGVELGLEHRSQGSLSGEEPHGATWAALLSGPNASVQD